MSNKADDKQNSKGSWHSRRRGITILLVLVVSVVVALILVNTQLPSQTYSANPVTFDCHIVGDDQAYDITVSLNLKDGMDESEALSVTDALCSKVLGPSIMYDFDSASVHESGIWTVNMVWGYSESDLGHWFTAQINPNDYAIVYSRCK